MPTNKQTPATGPKTPEGKARSSRNALKHGLTARQTVIPSESHADFDLHAREFLEALAPVGPLESFLAEQVIDASWRLRRCRALEAASINWRYAQNVRWREDHDRPSYESPADGVAESLRDDLGGAKVLANLSRHEARLERAFYRALHELERLQARRHGQPVPPPVVGEIDLVAPPEILQNEPPPPLAVYPQQLADPEPGPPPPVASPAAPPRQPRDRLVT
jgi:hypothetical protein